MKKRNEIRNKTEKGLKRVILSVLCMVVFIMAGVLAFEKYQEAPRDEIDKTMQKYAPTGASIAIIEHGEIKEIRNYGYADKEAKKPVTDQTRFKIASVSKTVTAYGVMQLVEQGKLDLDVSVNQYLTRWKIPESAYGEDNVTLRMLLAHTAGLTGSDEYGYTEPLPGIDEALRIKDVKLKREPGTQFEYSEFTGYGICQLVIEEVTGMPFEEYMVTQIFEPLGMAYTDYANESNEKGELAIPYAGMGKATEVVPIVMNGAGGVTTTAHDLAVFELALMQYYETGCGEMFTEQEHAQSSGGNYALGIIPRYLSDGRIVYEHNGTLTGWNAQLVIEPVSGNGIAVVSNSDKAYYMTYELMEVWSQMVLGERVSDPLMYQMNKIFSMVKMVLLVFVLFFGVVFIKNVLNYCYKWKISYIKTGISILVFFLIVILDGMLFYTDLLGKQLWGMDNYYLFTFFPLDFLYIQIEAGLLLLLFFVRLNLKKGTKGYGNSNS